MEERTGVSVLVIASTQPVAVTNGFGKERMAVSKILPNPFFLGLAVITKDAGAVSKVNSDEDAFELTV